MNIPIELLEKYNMKSLDGYKIDFGDTVDIERMFYEIFLKQTDHIPNKIIESLIENLASVTLTTFISVFIGFIKQVRVDYQDVLVYRKLVREEINKLESSQVTE